MFSLWSSLKKKSFLFFPVRSVIPSNGFPTNFLRRRYLCSKDLLSIRNERGANRFRSFLSHTAEEMTFRTANVILGGGGIELPSVSDSEIRFALDPPGSNNHLVTPMFVSVHGTCSAITAPTLASVWFTIAPVDLERAPQRATYRGATEHSKNLYRLSSHASSTVQV